MPVSARLIAIDSALRPGATSAAQLGLSPDDMLAFAALAREGGIRRGARLLQIPRSTVSRQLAALESALGGRLVSRSTRRFALTEMGRALLDKCVQLEDLLRATQDVTGHAAREPTGVLRIAASPIVGEEFLPDVLAEYAQKFPGVRTEVQLAVEFVDLRRDEIDVAIRTGPLAEKTDLFATRLGTSLKGQYASAEYLERRGIPTVPEDLAKHACIVVGGGRQSAWSFGARSSEVHVAVSGPLRVDSYRLARSAAARGLGVVRIPSVFARPLVATGELVPVLERFWQKTELFAVQTAGRPAPPKIRTFIELLRGWMMHHLPG
jgi:DNA-binding transcriptional LysR family regulator